ncbi:MAG TPA: GDSL-type esterase/lipase family protein [Verrucomicrobiae bacterium]|nr:GDSL-type esterase/lipase family protein [Verrucomicrobiae bacterium]
MKRLNRLIAAASAGVLALMMGTSAGRAGGQAGDAAKTNRWEKAIEAFEAMDRTNPPPLHAVLFTGASNIRLWKNLPQAFPAHRVINRGFGGAEMSDLTDFADRVVIPYRPKIVIIYAGDNDLADHKTPERVLEDFQAFSGKVHAALPETVIGCLAVKPSPSRARLVAQVKATDALLEACCRTNAHLVYIDDLTPMLSAGEKPRPELFGKDGLHLNERGRAVWISLIRPVLDRYDPPQSRTTP